MLRHEFVHSGLSCARSRLIARHVHTADVAQTLDGLEGNNHHNGGAVGVGNDATRTLQRIGGVAFGHHEGDIVFHTEGTGIVDHHRAIFGDVFGKLYGRATACASKGDIDVFEIVGVVAKFAHHNLLSAKFVGLSRAAFRPKESEFIDREIALGQCAQKFLAYGTTGAHYGYIHYWQNSEEEATLEVFVEQSHDAIFSNL